MFYLDVAAYLLVVSIILDDIDGHYSSQSSRHPPTPLAETDWEWSSSHSGIWLDLFQIQGFL